MSMLRHRQTQTGASQQARDNGAIDNNHTVQIAGTDIPCSNLPLQEAADTKTKDSQYTLEESLPICKWTPPNATEYEALKARKPLILAFLDGLSVKLGITSPASRLAFHHCTDDRAAHPPLKEDNTQRVSGSILECVMRAYNLSPDLAWPNVPAHIKNVQILPEREGCRSNDIQALGRHMWALYVVVREREPFDRLVSFTLGGATVTRVMQY